MSLNGPFGIQSPGPAPQRVSARMLERCATRLGQAFTSLRARLPDISFRPPCGRSAATVSPSPSPERSVPLKMRQAQISPDPAPASALDTGRRSASTTSVDLSAASSASTSATAPAWTDPAARGGVDPSLVHKALADVDAFFAGTPLSSGVAGTSIFRVNSSATRSIQAVVQAGCEDGFKDFLQQVVEDTRRQARGKPWERSASPARREVLLTQALLTRLATPGTRIQDLVPEPARAFLQEVVDKTQAWDGTHGSASHVVSGCLVLRGVAKVAGELSAAALQPQRGLYLSVSRMLVSLANGQDYRPPQDLGLSQAQRAALAGQVRDASAGFRAGLAAVAAPAADPDAPAR